MKEAPSNSFPVGVSSEPTAAQVFVKHSNALSPFYFTTSDEPRVASSNTQEFHLKHFACEAGSLPATSEHPSFVNSHSGFNKIKFKKKKLNKATIADTPTAANTNTSLPAFELNEGKHDEPNEAHNLAEKDALCDMIARKQSDRLDNQRCELNQEYSVNTFFF